MNTTHDGSTFGQQRQPFTDAERVRVRRRASGHTPRRVGEDVASAAREGFEAFKKARYTTAEERDAAIRRLRALAQILDAQFVVPGIGFRFGVDAVVGLIPAVGDVLMALVSLYIVEEARRLGVSKRRRAQMLANIGVDVVVGAVPLVGDLFDAAWKANLRNIRIIERSLRGR